MYLRQYFVDWHISKKSSKVSGVNKTTPAPAALL